MSGQETSNSHNVDETEVYSHQVENLARNRTLPIVRRNLIAEHKFCWDMTHGDVKNLFEL
ncbi:hypothetical protein BGAL_0197g00160 [Botrytis galanthina]|uniref:Uncharacterized protein n=1 Tax=Botrytis galanthina TaxID=278940 RepID=A0A4S8R5F7_9HELO|nr:hypothetical protein BGAL_0197g00160 [Botrytis galanthina]